MGKTYRSMEDRDDEYDGYTREKLTKAKKKAAKQDHEFEARRDRRDRELTSLPGAARDDKFNAKYDI